MVECFVFLRPLGPSDLFHPKVGNFLAGLGGRDVTIQNFEEMVERVASAKDGELPAYEFINVRE